MKQKVTEGWKITVLALGIKKRCRKTEKHRFSVHNGETLLSDKDISDFKKKALEILNNEMKSTQRATLFFKPCIFTTHFTESGAESHTIETVLLCDPNEFEIEI